jgi:SAM-dependent methyltransferase
MQKEPEKDGLIAGRRDIRQAYRDEGVAAEYIARRFVEPLGAMLHEQQIARMRQLIREADPARVLEIAPGPARLSSELSADLRGRETLMDASAQMLAQARSRLRNAGVTSSALVQADAFRMPFVQAFDLIYSFRLIRHFDAADRARLYAQIVQALRPGGLLVFDAVNDRVARPYRERDGGACQHYDALLTREQLATELAAAGFAVLDFDAVWRRYPLLYQLQVLVRPRSLGLARAAMRLLQRIPGGEPMEWIVTCQRR